MKYIELHYAKNWIKNFVKHDYSWKRFIDNPASFYLILNSLNFISRHIAIQQKVPLHLCINFINLHVVLFPSIVINVIKCFVQSSTD